MHYTLAVTEVQRFQQFVNIVSYIVVDESWVQGPEVRIVDVLEHQTRGLALAITDNIEQSDDVRATREIL